MKSELAIVKDLMSKYHLTNKDLFSFCICAVNFLEYYEEESMGDMMRDCPERYYGADSNNFRAVAGALSGEKKSQGWTDEDQFAYYMESIQGIIYDNLEDGGLDRFLEEYQRFEKVYRREIIVPFMLGCPVEEYDDTRFDDEDYIESIANIDNLTIYKTHQEREEAETKAWREKMEAEAKERLAKELENRKDDKDFTVLLASSANISGLEEWYNDYNKKYYPTKDYKVISTRDPHTMIIQTGGKTIEEVKERILDIVKRTIVFLRHKPTEEVIPVEKAFDVIPKILVDNGVTHVVTYY